MLLVIRAACNFLNQWSIGIVWYYKPEIILMVDLKTVGILKYNTIYEIYVFISAITSWDNKLVSKIT